MQKFKVRHKGQLYSISAETADDARAKVRVKLGLATTPPPPTDLNSPSMKAAEEQSKPPSVIGELASSGLDALGGAAVRVGEGVAGAAGMAGAGIMDSFDQAASGMPPGVLPGKRLRAIMSASAGKFGDNAKKRWQAAKDADGPREGARQLAHMIVPEKGLDMFDPATKAKDVGGELGDLALAVGPGKQLRAIENVTGIPTASKVGAPIADLMAKWGRNHAAKVTAKLFGAPKNEKQIAHLAADEVAKRGLGVHSSPEGILERAKDMHGGVQKELKDLRAANPDAMSDLIPQARELRRRAADLKVAGIVSKDSLPQYNAYIEAARDLERTALARLTENAEAAGLTLNSSQLRAKLFAKNPNSGGISREITAAEANKRKGQAHKAGKDPLHNPQMKPTLKGEVLKEKGGLLREAANRDLGPTANELGVSAAKLKNAVKWLSREAPDGRSLWVPQHVYSIAAMGLKTNLARTLKVAGYTKAAERLERMAKTARSGAAVKPTRFPLPRGWEQVEQEEEE